MKLRSNNILLFLEDPIKYQYSLARDTEIIPLPYRLRLHSPKLLKCFGKMI